jgi:hypothetical protein
MENPTLSHPCPTQFLLTKLDWYGLEAAMDPVAFPRRPGIAFVSIFDFGCQLSNGTKDCQTACQEPDLIFDSLYSLHNCLACMYVSVGTVVGSREHNPFF